MTGRGSIPPLFERAGSLHLVERQAHSPTTYHTQGHPAPEQAATQSPRRERKEFGLRKLNDDQYGELPRGDIPAVYCAEQALGAGAGDPEGKARNRGLVSSHNQIVQPLWPVPISKREVTNNSCFCLHIRAKALKTKLMQWGYTKNVKRGEVLHILRQKESRESAGKQSSFTLRQRPVALEKVTKHSQRARLTTRSNANTRPARESDFDVSVVRREQARGEGS
jgi:hypothetical protein